MSDPIEEALREEWEALGLMSYHGSAVPQMDDVWYADLVSDDIDKIRLLLANAAEALAVLRAERDEALDRLIRVTRQFNEGGDLLLRAQDAEAREAGLRDGCADLRTLLERAEASVVSLKEALRGTT